MGSGKGKTRRTQAAASAASKAKVKCNCLIDNKYSSNRYSMHTYSGDCDLHGPRVHAGEICYACGSELKTPVPDGLCSRCGHQRDLDEGQMEAGLWPPKQYKGTYR